MDLQNGFAHLWKKVTGGFCLIRVFSDKLRPWGMNKPRIHEFITHHSLVEIGVIGG
jgi:hypothetical protein